MCVCLLVAGGSAEGVLSPDQLASELGKQRRLYDELLDRTQQIQSVWPGVCVCVCVCVCFYVHCDSKFCVCFRWWMK